MKKSAKGFSCEILGKEYQLSCSKEELPKISLAVDHLISQLDEINSRGRVMAPERVAVLAAINISFELMEFKEQRDKLASYEKQIGDIQSKLERTIEQYRQISI